MQKALKNPFLAIFSCGQRANGRHAHVHCFWFRGPRQSAHPCTDRTGPPFITTLSNHEATEQYQRHPASAASTALRRCDRPIGFRIHPPSAPVILPTQPTHPPAAHRHLTLLQLSSSPVIPLTCGTCEPRSPQWGSASVLLQSSPSASIIVEAGAVPGNDGDGVYCAVVLMDYLLERLLSPVDGAIGSCSKHSPNCTRPTFTASVPLEASASFVQSIYDGIPTPCSRP